MALARISLLSQSSNSGYRKQIVLLLFCAACMTGSFAQKFTVIHEFNGSDGGNSISAMVQGRDGELYGITQSDGSHGAGTVFKMTTGGTLVTLHNFCSKPSCADGANPTAPLVLGTDGNFYGTTFGDGSTACGSPGCGTVFRITSAGKLTTLYHFCSLSGCQDGANPYAGLVQGTDGNLYGTTSAFGTGSQGTVFKITTSGQLTVLHTFNTTDGATPFGQLIQATDGNFYGTTSSGGTGGDGTIFKMTPDGTLTTVHNFSGNDGSTPYAGLFQSLRGLHNLAPGDFWGTTSSGGSNGQGTLFSFDFNGQLATGYNFCMEKGCADGATPFASVVMDNTGAIWGVTASGGSADVGMLFDTTDGGRALVLDHSFCATPQCLDGLGPQAPLMQHTNGTLYGITPNGANGFGAVYSISIGRPTFVKAVPDSARIGAKIGILGDKLSGTTEVKFGSLSAEFSVGSSTFITATVPASAKSAFITVTTSSKTFRSNQKFFVLP